MAGKWVQVKDANWKVPYLGGWCEGYVAMAWGFGRFFRKNGVIAGTESNGKGKTSYPTAMAHWKAQKGNHTGMPPKGITVPVFFSLGSTAAGHVAIRLSDMYVASSTKAGYNAQGHIHKNINDLIAVYGKYNRGCKYLGWSEYVNGVQVVKWVEDKPKPVVAPSKPTPVEPNYAKENNALLKQILALLQGLVDKFNSIFK